MEPIYILFCLILLLIIYYGYLLRIMLYKNFNPIILKPGNFKSKKIIIRNVSNLFKYNEKTNNITECGSKDMITEEDMKNGDESEYYIIF